MISFDLRAFSFPFITMSSWGKGQQSWGGKDWSGNQWAQSPWGQGGKKGGGKGSKKGKGQQEDENEYNEGAQSMAPNVNRIWSRYQFEKKNLRCSADNDNSCFVKNDKGMDDAVFWGNENTKNTLDASSSHVLRRPRIGVSECIGSITAWMEVAEGYPLGTAGLGTCFHVGVK